MTNENLSGTGLLVQRILDDANQDARLSAEEARQTVEKLRADNEAAVAQKRAEYEKSRASAIQGVIDGCRTRASIEGRKATLGRKREIIDEVFERAYQALLELDDEARGAVCRRMLLAEAAEGETVLPAVADRGAIQVCIEKGIVKNLRLDEHDAPYAGGFRLVGEGYEKDCSFASLIRELRDMEETAVAGLLFQ